MSDTIPDDSITALASAIEKLADKLDSPSAAEPVDSTKSIHPYKMLPPAHIVEAILAKSPIAPLLNDHSISDILINGPHEVYVDRDGALEKTDITFAGHNELILLADGIVHSIGRRIDPKRPLIDTRLPDGSRVNIVAPPMALSGINISIRKFPQIEITLETLVERNLITQQVASFLAVCAQNSMNVLISGSTGAGKTTLMNAMSHFIPESERIVTIEDTAELRLQQPHVVRLETKDPDTVENRTEEVNCRDLVRNALRMRPDRIIIGEVRGPEAYDMIQAMNTGHDGSMATIHANTPRDALTRMENLLSDVMSNSSVANVRRQIVSTINIIVQVSRGVDAGGKRKIMSISEIVGMEGDVPTVQELFAVPMGQDDAMMQWTNVSPRHPRLARAVREAGIFK